MKGKGFNIKKIHMGYYFRSFSWCWICFPDNHTEGATDAKRAFFMGNALVVGVVEKLGKSLASRI